jgi:hypothetical protein
MVAIPSKIKMPECDWRGLKRPGADFDFPIVRRYEGILVDNLGK